MFWFGPGMGWWGYAWMGFWVLLFSALLVAGIAVLIAFLSRDHRGGAHPQPAQSPEEVLAGRLARGEIDETEYRDRLAVLRDHSRT